MGFNPHFNSTPLVLNPITYLPTNETPSVILLATLAQIHDCRAIEKQTPVKVCIFYNK